MYITLKSEGYQISVSTLGSELKSFMNPFGREFIWYSDPAHWARSSPTLFPSIGNVRNNKTIIKNKEYPMPRHGFCKDMEFTLLSADESSATFMLESNKETLCYYPYNFKLQLNYELNGNKLQMTYTVSNESRDIMYYHIGAHPGFICPLEAEEVLEDYVLLFDQKENTDSIAYDLKKLCFCSNKKYIRLKESRILTLSSGMFDNDAIYFRHTASRGVSLINPVSNKGIHLAYPDFASLAIWTPAGGKAPFICLEPWNGAAIFDDEDDIFSHKRDIQRLEPGTIASYRLNITLIGY